MLLDMTSVIEQLLVYEPAVSLFFYFLSDFANQSTVCTTSQFILACCTTLSHLGWVNECEFFAIVQYYTSVYMPGYTDDKWTTGTTTCPCMPYTWTRTDNTELMECYYSSQCSKRSVIFNTCGNYGWTQKPTSTLPKKHLAAHCNDINKRRSWSLIGYCTVETVVSNMDIMNQL